MNMLQDLGCCLRVVHNWFGQQIIIVVDNLVLNFLYCLEGFSMSGVESGYFVLVSPLNHGVVKKLVFFSPSLSH